MRNQPAVRNRRIRLLRSLQEDGIGVFGIWVGEQATFYTFYEIPCEIGGRGFTVYRLGLGEVYHVRVGQPHDCSCDCRGFLYYHRCRHVLGLLALAQEGRI